MSSAPIYSLRVPEVFQALETSHNGLPTDEAESRRLLYGENVLSEQPHTPGWQKVIHQVRHPFVL